MIIVDDVAVVGDKDGDVDNENGDPPWDGYDCLGGVTNKLLTLMVKVSAILILVDSGVTLTPSWGWWWW